MSEPTCVKMYATRAEAELAHGILQASDIHGVVSADDAGGTFPTMAGGVKLLVMPEQLEAARRLLEVIAEPDEA